MGTRSSRLGLLCQVAYGRDEPIACLEKWGGAGTEICRAAQSTDGCGMNELVRYEAMCRAIAEAQEVDEVKEHP
jgi:hypothetical protein